MHSILMMITDEGTWLVNQFGGCRTLPDLRNGTAGLAGMGMLSCVHAHIMIVSTVG